MPKKRTDGASPELRVRVSEALRKKIEAAAQARDRSINTEIVQRLEASFVNVLLEELLMLAWGEATGQIAARAAYGGILKLRDADKETILKNVRRLLEEVQKGTKFK